MRLHTRLLPTFAGVGVIACATGSPVNLTQADRSAITSAVEARVNDYVDAARRRDTTWFFGFWADIDEFTVAADGNLVDRAAWQRQIREAVASTREIIDFQFSNRHTYVLARDAAVHTTQFRWAFLTTKGDTLRMHGSWSYVFKKLDGSWKVVHSAGTHLPG